MLERHIVDGAVFYLLLDELPEDIGGIHTILLARRQVLVTADHADRKSGEAWLETQRTKTLHKHVCGPGCRRWKLNRSG
jgi:hypothetical protein